jgi:hypothetical protein
MKRNRHRPVSHARRLRRQVIYELSGALSHRRRRECSIFRNNRTDVEVIVDAGLDRVDVEAKVGTTAAESTAWRCHRPEAVMHVLDLGAPVRNKGPLDAGASRVTPAIRVKITAASAW